MFQANRLKSLSQRRFIIAFVSLVLLVGILGEQVQAQILVQERKSNVSSKEKRQRGLEMLREIKKLIKKHYYDPKYKGIDIKKRFAEAENNIKKMEYNWQIFREIAQVLLEFDDSHTTFYPPGRSTRVDYGFTMQMIGNTCFVTKVKKKSDAEKKGLKSGFIITSIGRHAPARNNLWKINYLIKRLDPVKNIPLTVLDLEGKRHQLNVEAKFTTLEDRKIEKKKKKQEKKKKNKKKKSKDINKDNSRKKNLDYKCRAVNKETLACKLKTFVTEKGQIRKMMSQATNHKNLILDLRGNRGGYVFIEQFLTGYFFSKKVKIGDFVTRKSKEERFAKPMGKNGFEGELIVLIDSHSASAAEVFARTIQIEKRGKIIGDVSAGAVMTSYSMNLAIRTGFQGNEVVVPYGLNLTIGDLIMSDGKRLEHIGVTPDILIGPNGRALAEKKDPVLAYAARIFGSDVDGVETGKYGFLHGEN